MDATPLIPDSERYERHLILPEIGPGGQARLAKARVLVVGVGGLGSPVAMYLTAAGVGALGLVDGDRLEASNLQRQIVHGGGALGGMKVDSAAERLSDLNAGVKLEIFPVRLDEMNAEDIASRFDLALGCVDNLATRYLLNGICVKRRIPNIHGAASMFQGQVAVFPAGGGPCYRCFFREPPPGGRVEPPAERGVVSTLPGVVGSLMASEALKMLLGIGEPLVGRLLLFDGLAAKFREIRLRPDPDCPVCGGG